jgi:cytochrome-b5 reductase
VVKSKVLKSFEGYFYEPITNGNQLCEEPIGEFLFGPMGLFFQICRFFPTNQFPVFLPLTALMGQAGTTGKTRTKSKVGSKSGGEIFNAVLSNKEPTKFKLISKQDVISGEGLLPVVRFRFEIPDNKPLGLPVGQHIFVCAEIEKNDYMRAYTPTSSNVDLGYFELTIKIYPKGVIGNYLYKLSTGDMVAISGPNGKYIYQKNQFKFLGMLAGGTGIAPMIQIIDEIARNSDDTTKISLLYGNLSEKDIIFKEELETYCKKCPNLTVYHVLNKPPPGWTQGEGFITQEMIEKYCPKPSEGKMLLCGPPPMMNGMQTILKEKMGYSVDDLVLF